MAPARGMLRSKEQHTTHSPTPAQGLTIQQGRVKPAGSHPPPKPPKEPGSAQVELVVC